MCLVVTRGGMGFVKYVPPGSLGKFLRIHGEPLLLRMVGYRCAVIPSLCLCQYGWRVEGKVLVFKSIPSTRGALFALLLLLLYR